MPASWLPEPEVRAERERARFHVYLVRQRTSLTIRIHVDPVGFAASRAGPFAFTASAISILQS